MKHWLVVLMTVFVGGVCAASCATGTKLEVTETSSGSAGGTGAAGPGGAGGTATTQGTGADQTTSSSGGSGGAANPCEGVPCDTPPANECDGPDLKVYATVGTCDGGACTYGASTESCPNGCEGGACLGDPCIGVTCDSAPPPACADASTLDVPQEPGTCDGGVCGYSSVLVNCPFGCTAGQCKGDPCAGIMCKEPAASYCSDADHVRVRDLPGTCDPQDGQCDYTTHDEYCAFGCTNGACNNDPCVGVVCPAKASYCSDPSTVVQFDAGQCIDGLPCSYSSMSVGCPNGCINGQCVTCTVDAQCGAGNWCSANQCVACATDLHCGASCVACGGATPKCNGTSCVECLTSAECAAGEMCDGAGTCTPVLGCVPPATACTSGGSQDGGCANAYRISRIDAGTAAGFTVNNGYGLCNRANNFTTGNCGGNTGSDAEYRLFMRQGENANITLTRGNSTCLIGWAGTISLKIYQAACSADCSSCPQTCSTIGYCVQNNNQNTNFVAPSDGWYTIVVDSAGPVEDKGGVFYLNVKLTCAAGSCACQ
jgi:hypothetical protein